MVKKVFALALSLIVAMSVFAVSADEVKLVDMAGREVVLAKPAEKIVVLQPGDCEILNSLGLIEKVVGVGEYCDFPASVNDLPKVTTMGVLNVEATVALAPDVIIMNTMGVEKEVVETLENAGVKVIATVSNGIEEVYQAVEIIAKATGTEEAGAKVIEDMKAAFEKVKELGKEKVATVYYEISPLQWGLWTSGNGSFISDMGDMLGLDNVFAELGAWSALSEEQVLEKNPQIIISTSFGTEEEVVNEIKGRAGWKNIDAVKNNMVFAVDTNLFSRPSPRLVEALEILVELVQSLAADKAA